MAEKVDRRVRKTKAQLRAGLARLMQKKSIKEITVKELVEEVDINRSTFYLHYTDIYQMLESIEAELMDEVSHLVEDYPLDPLNNKESSYLSRFLQFWIIIRIFVLHCSEKMGIWRLSAESKS